MDEQSPPIMDALGSVEFVNIHMLLAPGAVSRKSIWGAMSTRVAKQKDRAGTYHVIGCTPVPSNRTDPGVNLSEVDTSGAF